MAVLVSRSPQTALPGMRGAAMCDDRIPDHGAAMASLPGEGRTRLAETCRTAARELSASGVGLSVMSADGALAMATASDPGTARIEELQFTLGEGPCIDAVAASRPVLVAELDHAVMRRWPEYGPAAYEAGIRAVFAFPLQVGAARLGVLDVFRTLPGGLSRTELGAAFTVVARAVAALLDGQERATIHSETDSETHSEGLDEAFEHRVVVFQAQGMVMVQLGSSLAEALVRMRAYAYAHDRRLGEVAADIVARRLQFDPDRP